MAEPAAVISVLSVGGKGSVLSPDAVYVVSQQLDKKVVLDPAALEKLSQRNSELPPSPLDGNLTNSIKLGSEVSRAALVVLLNKLVLSEADVGPVLPRLIEDTLSLGSLPELDVGSPIGFLKSLCDVNGKGMDEIGLNTKEMSALESSCAPSVGICAMLDSCASGLCKIADAVAALSCEAARADVAAFDLPVSGDGLFIKDQTGVASDMKVLLSKSKLVGQIDSEAFKDIPTNHASFRGAVRSFHGVTRGELNSKIKGKKSTGVWSQQNEKALVTNAVPLAMAVHAMCESSLGRAKLVIASISDALCVKVLEEFEKGCPTINAITDELRSILSKAASGSDCVGVLHQMYKFLVIFRSILAWEAALALFAIETDDSIEKPKVETEATNKVNSENAKIDKKSERKKKQARISVLRPLFMARVMHEKVNSIEDAASLVILARLFALYFDPKDSDHDKLLTKLKELVESNEARRLPKIPKGTRDFGEKQMTIRERAISIITDVFKRHGAGALDTPVFELRETLMGKYGEDSKLIYDLDDQGGELCSLRYDLTVPFARYLAMNKISAKKRYQIAKVYRRDNPSKGRYREFYQCDFDIAGKYETMDPEFEVIKILTELLNELNIGDYEIKLNHRKLLDGMLEICDVGSDKFRTVCSSIDKLDKQSFEQIRKELVEEKGLSVETADMIGTFVKIKGAPLDILSELRREGSQFLGNSGSVSALDDLEILFKALKKAKCLGKVVFDLSLARGLDYYTGVIFEAVFKGATQVGSIAAGGRYDNLVGMFSDMQVPAVGVSLGLERVFAIMDQLSKDREEEVRATETQVLVAILGKDLSLAAEVVSELWDAKIKAEYGLSKKPMDHIDRAKRSGIPWVVIIGESEQSSGVYKLKNIGANKEEDVAKEELVQKLRTRLNIDRHGF